MRKLFKLIGLLGCGLSIAAELCLIFLSVDSIRYMSVDPVSRKLMGFSLAFFVLGIAVYIICDEIERSYERDKRRNRSSGDSDGEFQNREHF